MHGGDIIKDMYYYLVSPTKIIRAESQAFTYSSDERLAVGAIVVVEVGKSEVVGVVLQSAREPEFKVKPVQKIVYTAPIPLPLVQTALWMSDYYNTHIATVWQTILPRGITKKRRQKKNETTMTTTRLTQRTAVTEAGKKYNNDDDDDDDQQSPFNANFQSNKKI